MGEGRVIISYYRIINMRMEIMLFWGIKFKLVYYGGEVGGGGYRLRGAFFIFISVDGFGLVLESYMGSEEL